MENLFLEIAELLTTASYTRNRSMLFDRIDDTLNRLRVQIRLSHEVGILSDAQYQGLAKALTETGRMVGGWKKADSNKISGYQDVQTNDQPSVFPTES